MGKCGLNRIVLQKYRIFMKCLVNFLYLIALLYLLPACSAAVERPIPGAERISLYKPLLKGKSIAVVANQTSMVGKVHLVDKLRSEGIRITTIFAPEHGFREMADAGQKIMNR